MICIWSYIYYEANLLITETYYCIQVDILGESS